ncbi:hypothetical protein [Clostridium sp. BSD9I1]|uniref:hypothetical protein n=1 Tax=Clostridium sp. BSD9I1 TaxID=2003589 RepID=UPI0016472662|nr:hypothetical protein [Clostridium sp. BSD9I1]
MTKEIKLEEDEAIAILKKTWKPLIEIEKENIKSPKYKELSKEGNVVEELIIEESGKLDEGGPLSHFKRTSTFIKKDDGNWILDRISGLQSIG